VAPGGEVVVGGVFMAVFADEEFVVEDEAVLVFVQEKLGVADFTGLFWDWVSLRISSSQILYGFGIS
jgi:hypothetical protein